MTTDYKALADRLVELGILEASPDGLYRITYKGAYSFLPANEVTNDWRVAGKCLERAYSDINVALYGDIFDVVTLRINNADELPLAIIQAFVEANT